jgi:hypothetical protein
MHLLYGTVCGLSCIEHIVTFELTLNTGTGIGIGMVLGMSMGVTEAIFPYAKSSHYTGTCIIDCINCY